MIDTKLILIEGIPGSGKSTTAWKLAAEIENNGRECRYFLEWAEDHPIFIGDETDMAEIISLSRPRAGSVLRQWTEFAKRAQQEETVTIIESRFWQTSLMFMYGNGAPEDEVIETNRQVIMAITGLKPVLIYFTHDDIMKALTRAIDMRGAEWEGRITGIIEQQGLATGRALRGREAWFSFFSAWTPVAEMLYDRFSFPKTKIHEAHSDWDLAMQNIMGFLGLV